MKAKTKILLILALVFSVQQIVRGAYRCEKDLIEVMFSIDSRVRMRDGILVDESGKNALSGVDEILSKAGDVEWKRNCAVPEAELDRLHALAESRSGRRQYNLNNIYRLKFNGDTDIRSLCRELEALPGIQSARPVPKPVRPPVPDYEGYQLYCNSSSNSVPGVGAYWAWNEPGGAGQGVTVCDVEYGWNFDHADISQLADSGVNPSCTMDFEDHGTAVAGILCADDNGWGITGICHDAVLKTSCALDSDGTWNLPAAIAWAVVSLDKGDVMLIEQQWDYNGGDPEDDDGMVPIEWWTDTEPQSQSENAVYVSIQQAVAVGIYVVEPAGNGAVDLDGLTWRSDSGAIIVGAGGVSDGGTYSEGAQQRLPFSSYGSRVDIQGHGEDVVTTGYGNLYSTGGENNYYTDTFAGTSGASAIIAGVVASCSGHRIDPLQPDLIRFYLSNNGTEQVTPPQGHIGVLPDMVPIFALLGEHDIPACARNGDVNNDFQVTAADARLAFMIVLKQYLPDDEEFCAADCNGDGIITVGDAQGIFRGVFGEDSCVMMGFEYISPGLYYMGSPSAENCRETNESVHGVLISKGFFISRTEVTQQQWIDVMGSNPSDFSGLDRPVESVTWYDAVIYCNRLSVSDGYTPCYYSDDAFTTVFDGNPPVTSGTVYWDQSADGYRLPTEAEWEYACRAGTTTSLNNGTDVVVCSGGHDANMDMLGWYYYNSDTGSGKETHPVGAKYPNAWGLYDMHGNVWEWCWDRYDAEYYDYSPMTDPTGPATGSARVLRGGAWDHYAGNCRSAPRNNSSPGSRSYDVGFRPVRSPDQ